MGRLSNLETVTPLAQLIIPTLDSRLVLSKTSPTKDFPHSLRMGILLNENLIGYISLTPAQCAAEILCSDIQSVYQQNAVLALAGFADGLFLDEFKILYKVKMKNLRGGDAHELPGFKLPNRKNGFFVYEYERYSDPRSLNFSRKNEVVRGKPADGMS